MVILMENAVKYSPASSPIEVEAGVTEGGVLVSVLDRGMGISEDNRERVFDRFFQEEEVAHHSKPGMGMGLYIAGTSWRRTEAHLVRGATRRRLHLPLHHPGLMQQPGSLNASP